MNWREILRGIVAGIAVATVAGIIYLLTSYALRSLNWEKLAKQWWWTETRKTLYIPEHMK